MRPRHALRAVIALLLVGAASAPGRGQAPDAPSESLRDVLVSRAELTVLADRCGECHRSEFAVWERTPHATGFDTLHRQDSAKAIYRKLGLRLIKRGTDETTPACLQCHYTPVLRDEDELRAGEGVSCESCHGPAREWISVHNDYGVPEPDFQQAARLESPEHRAQRITGARAAGMRRPSDLYDVAANCFGCHTVPNEELVNLGGHSTGSDFELVEWSQGEIRHNFLESFKTADGTENAERPAERKRVMYVVGRALDLEYSLRGIAVAREDDLYVDAMVDRANAAVDTLLDIMDRTPVAELEAILDVFDGAPLAPGNQAALEAAAAQVGELTRAFIADTDGTELASLDPLWNPELPDPFLAAARAGAARPVESSAPAPAPGVPSAASAVPPGTVAASAGAGPANAGRAGASPVVPSASSPATPSYPTRQRPAWREDPAHDYVRKVPCGRCHNAQERWWRDDVHSETARPFRQNDERYVAIAESYGTGAGAMAQGNQICMWCHGTVVGNPARDVRFGVGCQRCHGPGADYEEPHEDSYTEAVALGLSDLKTADVRAGTCAGCHYITDPGLLAAGHASGEDFDLSERVGRIVHWGDAFGGTAQEIPAATLVAAHERAIEARGPVPAVTLRADAPPPAPVARRVAPPAVGGGGTGQASSAEDPTAPAAPGGPAAADARTEADGGPAVARTGPATSGAPSTTAGATSGPDDPGRDLPPIEDVLLDLRDRLEELYRQLGR